MAFVAANAVLDLPVAIATAIGVALAIAGRRLLRREPIRPALSGLIGVTVTAGVAAWTGSAGGFFLVAPGADQAGFPVFLASLIVRLPLTGLRRNALRATSPPGGPTARPGGDVAAATGPAGAERFGQADRLRRSSRGAG